jgi:hypothetical protein
MRPFQRADAGGEGGIRTHGGFDTTLLFESSTLNRSDTSPREIVPNPQVLVRRGSVLKAPGIRAKESRFRVIGSGSVRLVGFEPTAFGSATQRSIP